MTKAEFLSAFEEGWAARSPEVPRLGLYDQVAMSAATEAWEQYKETMDV